MTVEELMKFFNSLPGLQSAPYIRAESINININVDFIPMNASTGTGSIGLQVAQGKCPSSEGASQTRHLEKGGETMLESIDMGQVVTALQAAVLAAGAKEVAGSAVKSTVASGKKVLGWLREKLAGFHAQGLEHACEKPEEDSRWETFKTQLQGLIKEDPAFAEEFGALLKEAMPEAIGDTITQTARVGDVSGKVNIAQIGKGSGNQITQELGCFGEFGS
jgi:hypothetical protein